MRTFPRAQLSVHGLRRVRVFSPAHVLPDRIKDVRANATCGAEVRSVSRCRIAVISRRTQVVTQRSNNTLGAAVTRLLHHRRISQPLIGQCRQFVHRVQARRNTWGRPATSGNRPIKPPKRALEAPQPLGLIHAFAVCFTHRRRRSPVAIGCAVR